MLKDNNKFIVLGTVVALLIWFIEVFIHVLIFKTGSFTEELFSFHDYNELWMRIIIVAVVLLAGFISQNMANKITKAHEKERENFNELEAAIIEIKILQGILPICASCKKIRDDKGSWSKLEAYIAEHSEAEFSQSMCPDCSKKLHPEFSQEQNK